MTPAWPEGVIARCITAGGATADVIHEVEVKPPYADRHTVRGACTGERCDESRHSVHYSFGKDENPEDFEEFQQAIAEVQFWAKSHSKTCRWVPKPCS